MATQVKQLTCIVCPRGCQMTVTLKDGKPTQIEGNQCKRGADYATAEFVHPTRTLTTTVRLQSGDILPVKTNKPIPKELLFDAMKVISALHPTAPIQVGDVLISNLLDTGADVVACSLCS